MPTIEIMNQNLANMIAAGEVVDRPASVIKELVENAIDARASIIKVDVFEFGMKEIRVTDNGIGMDAEDAKLAFMRHATSKIKDAKDLNHILSLGFRGEALAAIASVSKVTLKTKQNQNDGFMVMLEGGKIVKQSPTAMNVGTEVSVYELFYNTPARFKYIKSEFAEKSAILDIFDHLALAHPEIAFSLSMDDKKIKETYGNQDIPQLIYQIYGSNLAKGMQEIDDDIQKIKIKGYLLSPEHTRSKKKDIRLFVNGRYIKNYRLIQAIIDGYHGRLMVGKYPIVMLYLEMDPTLIDVNVHPQKYEVKFVNELVLAFVIEEAIKRALSENPQKIVTPYEALKPDETYVQPSIFEETLQAEDPKMDRKRIPDMDYIGTFSGTYLLFQNRDGLYLVDQHAAEERIRYEYYQTVFKHPQFAKKQMLFPKVLDLVAEDYRVIVEQAPIFERYGFTFDHDVRLLSIPTWLTDDEIEISLESMVHMIQEKGEIDLFNLRDRLMKDVSCKGAIKANKPLNTHEIDALMKRLRELDNPYSCPHGRPTIIHLSHYDVERMFKRVVS